MVVARGVHGPFVLAVCAEMVFRDLPIVERVRRLTRLDVQVEIWDWTKHDIDALVSLRDEGAVYSSMTGYVRGGLVEPSAVADLLATAEKSIPVAKRLGITRLNLHGTGLGGDGLPVVPVEKTTGAMWLAARDTLVRMAELGAKNDVVFVLENLNLAVDHPGVPFARADDCLALVQAVDHPNLRLMLDLYHAQIGEGNLIDLCRRALPFIGEIQVADVPGRCEPGTGEINYPRVAAALAESGYRGTVGLEGWPSGDDTAAVERFRAAFGVKEGW
ncbi:TIM barrel protein [Amycolatopsis vastitatis]|uniref:Hydroxypyruvate isomerase n=1 Tax=Amycolatopsis vastitatis TaxID=1905142 RepID=A0A229SR72_9PSEU|nr:TIM barrel protein [Amycolatopsis vastitatis]OXM61161.1 hydroxypyruvate isomerase [Amycolatopsis vastitatis]